MNTLEQLVQRFPAWILDLEGTLINFEPFHFEAHSQAFSQATSGVHQGISPESIIAMPGAVGGGDRKIAEQLKGECALVEVDHHLQLKRQLFHELIEDAAIECRPGVLELVSKIRSYGARIAIASLTIREEGERYLAESTLGQFVDKTTFFEDVGPNKKKPDPEVYLVSMRKLGVTATQVITCEDSLTGVKAARAAGVEVVFGSPIFPQFNDALLAAGACSLIDWTAGTEEQMIAAARSVIGG